MSSIIQCVDAFGCLLKAIHDTLNPALWVIVYDETFSGAEATKLIHLHKLVGLNSREFTCLLRVCDLEGGKSLRNKWLQLFQTSNIDGFELDTKKVLGTRTWVLRIGNKEKGSFKDAKQQLQRRVRAPSLNRGIIQQLKTKLKQCINEVMNTETTDAPRVNNETTQHNNSDRSNETPQLIAQNGGRAKKSSQCDSWQCLEMKLSAFVRVMNVVVCIIVNIYEH